VVLEAGAERAIGAVGEGALSPTAQGSSIPAWWSSLADSSTAVTIAATSPVSVGTLSQRGWPARGARHITRRG